MEKFYAVKKGRKVGVFRTWAECKKQVDGFPGATYKSFTSYEEAKSFAFNNVDSPKKLKTPSEPKAEIIAYIDGSYNDKQKYYSYASIIFHKNQKLKFAGAENDKEILDQRNVAGEIKAAIQVIEYALDKKAKSIEIFYDYAGIEKWAKNEWKANNPFTQNYVAFIKKVSPQIEIFFSKVKSHSGDKYNDEVDLLAKAALQNLNNKIEEIDELDTENTYTKLLDQSTKYLDYETEFKLLKSTKKNISLGLIMGNEIFSSEHLFEVFKTKWRNQNRKLNEYLEIKAAFDTEKQIVILRILNNKQEWELIELDKGDMELNG
ncbi:viroplasmin family protein [Paenibacillus amylolyticus]|uniref:ribonuclease H1 domain-containing protein n=1 Tax=Paenibacillus amylolyticus TaxID=1451 RepID=UPI003879A971